MAGKITELVELTDPASADLLEAVDVSDTTMAASGTNKRLPLTDFVDFLHANGVGNGVAMSPTPPMDTDVLWADTDEVGSVGGINAVFSHIGPVAGYSSAPNTQLMVDFTNVAHGTPTTLPAGWSYFSGTRVVVPTGVYSFYLGWSAPDQYWYGQVQGSYQLGTTGDPVDINPGASVSILGASAWRGAATGTVVLHNSEGISQAPWFNVTLTHPSTASATNAVKWQFNVVRLGNIPS